MLSIRDNDLEQFQYYQYVPSKAAAVIFTLVFFGTTGLHVYQVVRTKAWFMIPFCLGGIFEIGGYIARGRSSTESPDYTLGPYIVQSLLLLLAPALLAAAVYMELGRLVILTAGDHALPMSRRRLTKVFVSGDILSFLMQAGGGGMMAASDMQQMGEKVILGGLFLQLAFFGLFMLAAMTVQIRLNRRPTEMSLCRPWRRHMWSLYAVSLCIFVRSIVRFIEYAQGFSGYIISHEIFLYVFDGLLISVAMVTLNCVHPSEVVACIKGGFAAYQLVVMRRPG